MRGSFMQAVVEHPASDMQALVSRARCGRRLLADAGLEVRLDLGRLADTLTVQERKSLTLSGRRDSSCLPGVLVGPANDEPLFGECLTWPSTSFPN